VAPSRVMAEPLNSAASPAAPPPPPLPFAPSAETGNRRPPPQPFAISPSEISASSNQDPPRPSRRPATAPRCRRIFPSVPTPTRPRYTRTRRLQSTGIKTGRIVRRACPAPTLWCASLRSASSAVEVKKKDEQYNDFFSFTFVRS
jgi:hypothetical protein